MRRTSKIKEIQESIKSNKRISKISVLSIFNRIQIEIQRLQSFETMIPRIVSSFLSNQQDKAKAFEFKSKFKNHLNGTYIDILLLLKEFPEFSIYNYINVLANADLFTEDKKETLKLLLISRNNIILNLLLIATQYHHSELNKEISFDGDEPFFNDLSFLNSTMNELHYLIIDDNQLVSIEYDVELLFLALLGFDELAYMIKQKHFKYFKEFIEECDLSLSFDEFLSVTLNKKDFNELTKEEIIVLRRIINNTAKRKLYFGICFLLKNVEYICLLSEGRIWKSIGNRLSHEEVFALWLAYREHLPILRNTDLKETLSLEYQKRLNMLSSKIKTFEYTHSKGKELPESMQKNYYAENKLKKEIQLYHVTCLKELFVIFFQNDLKELVQYFFDEFKSSKKDIKIPIDIYEICLDYDEDISM